MLSVGFPHNSSPELAIDFRPVEFDPLRSACDPLRFLFDPADDLGDEGPAVSVAESVVAGATDDRSVLRDSICLKDD